MAGKTDSKLEHMKSLRAAYAGVFKGPLGNLIMKDLKEWCHVDKTSYSPTSSTITAFNEGKRFIFLRICQMAKIDLDKIMKQSDNQGPDV